MRTRGLWLAAALLGASCAEDDGRTEPTTEAIREEAAEVADPSRRVIWLAMDGLDGNILGRLAVQGDLPAFRELFESGARANLLSLRGFLSPALWTTQATGVEPDVHGISGFTRRDEAGAMELVTSSRRTRRALWDILGEHDRSVCVVGWLGTWPAYPVRGSLVSSYCSYALERFSKEDTVSRPLKGSFDGEVPRLVEPPSLLGELQPLAVAPEALGPEELSAILDARDVVPDSMIDRMIESVRYAHAADRSFAAVARHLEQRDRPDFLTVYYGGADVLSHRLWRMSFPSPHTNTPEEERRFGGAIDAYYRYLDRELAGWLERLDEDTILLVTSDHGFQPSESALNSGTHRLQGVMLWYGRGVRRGARLEDVSLLDVMPTLLAVHGLPAARDLTGRVIREVFEPDFLGDVGASIETYERTPFRIEPPDTPSSPVDAELMERLEALGYVGESGVDHATMGERDR